ncbi:MAG TPA: hypothetical protein VGI44_06880 [Acidimicrobiales bacterium]
MLVLGWDVERLGLGIGPPGPLFGLTARGVGLGLDFMVFGLTARRDGLGLDFIVFGLTAHGLVGFFIGLRVGSTV